MRNKFLYSGVYCFLLLLTSSICSISFGQEKMSGSGFYESIRELNFEAREERIKEEFEKINFPEFLINFQEIKTTQPDAAGNQRELSFFVSPQYLAVGNINDYFIMPMGPHTAQYIARKLNASLPTPKVVDLIYEAAEFKPEPFTFYPRGNRNETVDILYDHSRVIQAQIKAAGYKPDTFTAGTKKDIVISSKLRDENRTHHVIIYGWHKPDGKPIQPETNIHIDTYVDYSHGVRLISNKVLIDGKEYNYEQILTDPDLHTLLNYEDDPLKKTRY